MTPTQQLLHEQAEGAMNRGDTVAAMRYRRLLSASLTEPQPAPEPKTVNLLQRLLGRK